MPVQGQAQQNGGLHNEAPPEQADAQPESKADGDDLDIYDDLYKFIKSQGENFCSVGKIWDYLERLVEAQLDTHYVHGILDGMVENRLLKQLDVSSYQAIFAQDSSASSEDKDADGPEHL